MLSLGTSWPLLDCWLGALFVGALPVATAPGLGMGAGEGQMRKMQGILDRLGAVKLICTEAYRAQAREQGYEGIAGRACTPEEVRGQSPASGFREVRPSAEAIAFGPTGPPWILSDDTIWRLGVPGSGALPAALGGGGPGPGLAVADDGTVWLASELGLHSFDGRTWTEHWSGAGLVDVDVRPDG